MYIPASDAHRVFAHLSLSLTGVLLQKWQRESYREALRRISRHLRQAVIGQALPVYVSFQVVTWYFAGKAPVSQGGKVPN
jgi:hypothetical protein